MDKHTFIKYSQHIMRLNTYSFHFVESEKSDLQTKLKALRSLIYEFPVPSSRRNINV